MPPELMKTVNVWSGTQQSSSGLPAAAGRLPERARKEKTQLCLGIVGCQRHGSLESEFSCIVIDTAGHCFL